MAERFMGKGRFVTQAGKQIPGTYLIVFDSPNPITARFVPDRLDDEFSLFGVQGRIYLEDGRSRPAFFGDTHGTLHVTGWFLTAEARALGCVDMDDQNR